MSKYLPLFIGIGLAVGFAASGREQAAAPAPDLETYTESPIARQTILERQDDGHFYANAGVNGLPVHFVVDTGASTVALTVGDARRLGIPFSEAQFTVIGRGASGPVRGTEVLLDRVSLDGKTVSKLRAVICEGLDISLLGQNYLARIGRMTVQGNRMFLG